MKKEKWVHEQIHVVRDQTLRTYVHRFALSIQKRIKYPNASVWDINRYESSIVSSGRNVVDRYKELLAEKYLSKQVVIDHSKSEDLIRHLLDQAHENIPRHHPAKESLEYIMSHFEVSVEKFSSTSTLTLEEVIS